MASAAEEKNRLINEAQGYANSVIPRARGEAQRRLREGEGYRTDVVNRARGEAQRFADVLAQYQRDARIFGPETDYLRPLGFEVHEAVDGEQGLAQAFAVRPDLILMDITMPVIDGHEATRRLRASNDLHDVPVVSISASATQASRQRSFEAGASAFLAKPVDLRELTEEIGRLLALEWQYGP